MEEKFIEWLNSFGYPLGTWLAIIIGGFLIFGLIIASIKKVKKTYDERIANKILKEEEEKNFRDSMQQIAHNVTTIQTSLATLTTNHQTHIDDINVKLDDMNNALDMLKRESRSCDNEIESKLLQYQKSIDTRMGNIDDKLSSMDDKSTLLIESDKEGIKAYIVDKYYQACVDEYIELHTMETLELRYEKYLQENGNTYVGKLMEKLRLMPNEPPSPDKTQK